MKTLSFFSKLLLFTELFWTPLFLFAGTVTKISEDKVVIDFNGETTPSLQQKVIILDQTSHKEVGVVQILKTKDSRALGKLLNGSAKPGDATDIMMKHKKDDNRLPAEQGQVESIPSGRKPKRLAKKSIYYGVGADFVYTYVELKTSGSSGSLNGNGFGVGAALDYSLTPTWILQGRLGWHPFNMQSTAESKTVSSIKTNYLATGAVVRYAFENLQSGLWLGGGLGYYLAMSSNVTPKTNEMVFIGSAGYNMRLTGNYFMIKGDFILFQPKKSSGISYQSMQFILGGTYFF